jgi:hypothetical protein
MYRTQEPAACFQLKIGSGIARGGRYQPPSVGCSVRTGQFPSRFAPAEVAWGMISQRHFVKRTFGPEMHFILQMI